MNDHDLEWIVERAAILEFEAGYPRFAAERVAKRMWEQMMAQRTNADRYPLPT